MLANKTIFITGASRGIGKAIAVKAAKDGANIVIAAKTTVPNPKLEGTIYTAAREVESAGGKCLPCAVDIRDEKGVEQAVQEAVTTFGGIDILVNNASAISLNGTLATSMKTFDLMHSINCRGTFMVSQKCIPHLKKGKNPQILNISPPLSMNPVWFKNHVAYTIAKYGMSMCVLGMAEELKPFKIAVNAIWPKTAIWTAAMEFLSGKKVADMCRKPEIMADAAYIVLTRDSSTYTGNFYVDENVLRETGVENFDNYAIKKGNKLILDFFLDTDEPKVNTSAPKSVLKTGDQRSEVMLVSDHVKSIINSNLVNHVRGTFIFYIDECQPDVWFLDLKNGQGSCGFVRSAENIEADAQLSMNGDTFVSMFQGKLDPSAAVASGRIQMSGNVAMALKLESIMKQLSF